MTIGRLSLFVFCLVIEITLFCTNTGVVRWVLLAFVVWVSLLTGVAVERYFYRRRLLKAVERFMHGEAS